MVDVVVAGDCIAGCLFILLPAELVCGFCLSLFIADQFCCRKRFMKNDCSPPYWRWVCHTLAQAGISGWRGCRQGQPLRQGFARVVAVVGKRAMPRRRPALPLLYLRQAGVPHDDYEAVNWFRKARRGRQSPVQSGVNVPGGRGEWQNYRLAAEWHAVLPHSSMQKPSSAWV